MSRFPPRQQTLRATIDWSHELLTEEQQTLFARLAVFAGGFTLEAVEAVCGAALDPFAALLDGGLLLREQPAWGPPRFRMLDPVREYAAERLAPDDGEVTQARHAAFFVEFAERLRPSLTGPEAPRAVVVYAPDEVRNLTDTLGPVPSPAFMRVVKDEFDPDHRMAPGRFALAI